MKMLMLLALLGAVGWFVFTRVDADNPEHINEPVYAEMRVDAKIQGRELNMILFGEMASDEDCQARTERVWKKVVECKECTLSTTTCQKQLAPRYQKLFDNTAIHSTYLTFTRGNRYERNGRMVIYGLTSDEGDAMCEAAKADFQSRYEGEVKCVHGLRT